MPHLSIRRTPLPAGYRSRLENQTSFLETEETPGGHKNERIVVTYAIIVEVLLNETIASIGLPAVNILP